jgi:hypothetical protein
MDFRRGFPPDKTEKRCKNLAIEPTPTPHEINIMLDIGINYTLTFYF